MAAQDGELSIKRRVALDAHLDMCPRCSLAQDELTTIGAALRRGAVEHRPDEAAFARLAPEVLARVTYEHDTRWIQRVRDALDDGPRLWIMGGALAATVAAALLVAAVLNLATPMHPSSLARQLQTSSRLGSNANPLWLVAGVTLPRVSPDTRAAAMLIQPLPPLALDNLALKMVVTREGAAASVEVIREGAPDAALTHAVSRLASDVRFEPARAGGAAVAVNVVWLLERTTVAPIPDGPPVAGGA